MALYQPKFVLPDVRSGLGAGVVDAGGDLPVSWFITGPSGMTAFEIVIALNDENSTVVYDTGQISTGVPIYGADSSGQQQRFVYSIPGASLAQAGFANGNTYKITITQWWSASDSVTQNSPSVFATRQTPVLSIAAIGTGGVISAKNYTFTGTYTQAQGDVLNWLRWQIASYDDGAGAVSDILYDSGNISGTMLLSCTYDGFFDGQDYAVKLSVQTENGVEADTGWVTFSASYAVSTVSGEVTAGCVGGTDAVLVNWEGIGYIPGTASGPYTLADGLITLPAGSSVLWNQQGTGAMSFDEPWSVVWKGTLARADATIFTINVSNGVPVVLSYDYSGQTISLKRSLATLVSVSGIINSPTVTAILTPDYLHLRVEYMSGGLYPAEALYPGETLYPRDDGTPVVDIYMNRSVTYTQSAITSVTIGGVQVCDFIEVIAGDASAATVQAAIQDGTYVPGLNDADYMIADFTDGLDAGTLSVGGQTITGYDLYRLRGDDTTLVKVASVTADVGSVYDYGAASQQGPYTYYLYPKSANTYPAAPIISGTVMPCWWNYTLMECAETADKNVYTVLAAYRFRLNIETGAVSNNNTPTLLQNFTPYPKIQLAPQNYKTGTLTGLIGAVSWESGQPEYSDTLELRDAIFALSLTQNALFLKTRKGDLIRVRISGPVSVQTGDGSREQMQTATIPWAEVGSAEGVSLYSTEYAGVQETEGSYTPQYYVDASDATADDANIRIYKTAYGADGKMVGDAKVYVDGKTLVLPAGMEE